LLKLFLIRRAKSDSYAVLSKGNAIAKLGNLLLETAFCNNGYKESEVFTLVYFKA
jgi:hypothetical protein